MGTLGSQFFYRRLRYAQPVALATNRGSYNRRLGASAKSAVLGFSSKLLVMGVLVFVGTLHSALFVGNFYKSGVAKAAGFAPNLRYLVILSHSQ